MVDSTQALQLILGPDKSNPSFCLYTDEEEKNIHVYYGLELLEVVPNNRESPAYRLLAARLYNANVRVRTLEEVFGLDRKTMRKWGLALRSGDRQWLIDVLQGRWGRRKVTLEIESFVRHRYQALRAEGVRDYRKVLCREVERVFGVKISGEALRGILTAMRAEQDGVRSEGPSASSEAGPRPESESGVRSAIGEEGVVAEESPETKLEGAEAGVVESLRAAGGQNGGSAGTGEVSLESAANPLATRAGPEEACCAGEASSALAFPLSSKILPPKLEWPEGQTVWCEHAGLFLFAEALGGVSQGVEPAQPWLGQALANVMAGAVNVEQTKFLNDEDLELMLGPLVRGLGPQRHLLKELAEGATADALLRWNGQRVGAQEVDEFYFDPHTKHYTGMAEVLKGWCPTIRWADKAVHSDFIHTRSGQPIYFECTDNFEDLRTRLWGVVERARKALGWSKDKRLTLVIDRAVFGKETFERIFQEPALRLITWEKGYRAGGWEEGKVRGQFILQRPRNRAADLLSYQFRYINQKWERDPQWRQLIVRATHPSGRTAEVGILTDDWERPAQSIIRLMFSRWLQENDFKYLDQHFGINQITSYGSVEYEELKEQLTDREVESGAYRALREKERQVRARLGQLLFGNRQAQNRQAARTARLAELEAAEAADNPAGEDTAVGQARRQELGRLRAAQKREPAQQAAREEQIQKLQQQLDQVGTELGQTQRKVSRLEDLIARQMVRLDTGPKRLLDAIKVVARNEFYRALRPFKAAYDNYRDDHEHFRRLSQSAGVLRWNGRQLEVHLMPRAECGRALRKLWVKVLDLLTAAGPLWPDGSGRPVRLRLGSRRELQVAVHPIED
jgi:hypothetical protein